MSSPVTRERAVRAVVTPPAPGRLSHGRRPAIAGIGAGGHAKCVVDALRSESLAGIAASPFIPRRDEVRGFVYEVETGTLREVV